MKQEIPNCLNCGNPVPIGRKKFCSQYCANKHWKIEHAEEINTQREENKQERKEAEELKRLKRKNNSKSIIEMNREALAMGMTYGEYVVYLERNAQGQQS